MATRRFAGDSRFSPAQWYSLVAGIALLAAGILGFIADSSFDFGSDVEGDSFIGFEVNGTHNIVHLASGVIGLAAASRRMSAWWFALLFGLVYGAVAVIGLIQSDHVLGIIPVNGADHVLHVALAALGLIAAAVSRRHTDEVVLDRDREMTTG
jgi:hypothetical protein